MKPADFNVNDRINSRLLESGYHFLTGPIEQSNIDDAIKWIVFENLDTRVCKRLNLFINSPGGDLYNAFALIDVMRSSYHKVSTTAMGSAMSAAFLILASGAKGSRYAYRNTGIMCHQYSDEAVGKHHDLKAYMQEGTRCHERMFDVLRSATSLPAAKIRSKLLTATDTYITAQEALELRVIDHIL